MYAKTGIKQHLSRNFFEQNCSTQRVEAGCGSAVRGELGQLWGEEAVECLPAADEASVGRRSMRTSAGWTRVL